MFSTGTLGIGSTRVPAMGKGGPFAPSGDSTGNVAPAPVTRVAACSTGSSGMTSAVIAACTWSTMSAKDLELTSRGKGSGLGMTLRMRPGRDEMMTIRVAMKTASTMLCVTRKMLRRPARPEPRQRSTTSVRRLSAVSTSSALKGSSMHSTSGWATRARAKPTRWRIPPDNCLG